MPGEKMPFLHRLYIVGLFLKGFDGFLEMIGGVLLFFLSAKELNRIVYFLTQRELAEDPPDRLANAVIGFVHHLPLSLKLFGALYLLIHGFIKIFIALNLLKERLWAYPLGLTVLLALLGYQMYRLFLGFSWPLFAISLFDLAIVFLILNEYRRAKSSHEPLTSDS